MHRNSSGLKERQTLRLEIKRKYLRWIKKGKFVYSLQWFFRIFVILFVCTNRFDSDWKIFRRYKTFPIYDSEIAYAYLHNGLRNDRVFLVSLNEEH